MAWQDLNSWLLPLSPEDLLACPSTYLAKVGAQSHWRRSPRYFSILNSTPGEFGYIPTTKGRHILGTDIPIYQGHLQLALMGEPFKAH